MIFIILISSRLILVHCVTKIFSWFSQLKLGCVLHMHMSYMLSNTITLYRNTWNHLTVCQQMSSSSFKNKVTCKLFIQAAVVSILLYGCTTWTLTKPLEKKLDSNYTRMLRAILNKSWWQHPTKHQLYGHPPPITKSIQVRRTRHAGHCWRSRDELISDVLLWTSTYGRAKAGRPAWTYIQQLCEDTGCSPEDLPEDHSTVCQQK